MMCNRQESDSGENPLDDDAAAAGGAAAARGHPMARAWAAAAAIGMSMWAMVLLPLCLPVPFDELSATHRLWLALIPIHVAGTAAALAVVLTVRPRQLRPPAEDGPRPSVSSLASAGRVLLTVIAVHPVTALLTLGTAWMLSLTGYEPNATALVEMILAEDGALFWSSLVVSTVVLAPITEEFLFRLVLFDGLRAVRAPVPAVMTALAFAVVHQVPEQIPGLFLLGLVLQRSRRTSEGLAQPICIHAGFNAVSLALLLAAKTWAL